ncbi:CYFA0S13e00210g1_1 [Cyberlindnera fabianii]|uniref:CYFA0S13e00210g1_1 n=1 Tax=Cyberlindnera fabianii TaxID=36022 RepID=A0A061B7M0_CYBFA|nr:CYFA0S13e00210g1_1 [Cyberlindnera fabianii]
MDFDPLSFFTSDEVKKQPSQPTSQPPKRHEKNPDQAHHQQELTPDLTEEPSENSEDEQDDGLIHIFDLPPLTPNLPREVLLTVLELLKPDQTTNFGPSDDQKDKAESEILESKGVTTEQYNSTKCWLLANGYKVLARNLLNIHFTQDFFSYLNKILSSPHFVSDDAILQSASLRISENSGRTARPNFQRKIVVKNLEKPILLNEPALIADSLGLKTWGSSLILSEHLLEQHQKLVLDPVLELGAGTGLVGITLGILGYDVTLTDLPEILPNLETNVRLNGLNSDCLVLDWTNPSSFIEKKGQGIKYKTIVVADPIYSADHPRWVINMIITFLEKTPNSRVLLQIPVRQMFEGERELLWKIVKEEGFEIKDEKLMSGYDDFGAQKFIYKELRWGNQHFI